MFLLNNNLCKDSLILRIIVISGNKMHSFVFKLQEL